MSFFRTATDRVTARVPVRASTETSVLFADIVNTRRLPTRKRIR